MFTKILHQCWSYAQVPLLDFFGSSSSAYPTEFAYDIPVFYSASVSENTLPVAQSTESNNEEARGKSFETFEAMQAYLKLAQPSDPQQSKPTIRMSVGVMVIAAAVVIAGLLLVEVRYTSLNI